MNKNFNISEELAHKLDQQDPLSDFRKRFYLPEGSIYMDGNSLGLMSKDAEESVERVMKEWKSLAIGGWMEANPPWFTFAEELAKKQAKLVGAKAEEVIVTGSTTVNMHNLLATFFKPINQRTKLVVDELNFPSDIYAVKSQLRLHDLDAKEHLVVVESRDGRTIEEEDIVKAMTKEVALVMLPSVYYRSGQLLDMAYLTAEAHKRGILIGFDCCHSAGVIPHQLSEIGVDFAFWCNYKYLNNGPGGTASLYVNERHFGTWPGLAGWWGNNKDTQFDMSHNFDPAPNAGAWQIGTVNLLSTAPLEGSLNIFLEAGINRVRQKSLHQTAYLMFLIDEILTKDPYNFTVGTPRQDSKRGGHVALEHPTEAIRINEALKKRGVVPDFRYPNVIRLAPIALYNTYYEIWQVVQHLKEIIDKQEYTNFSKERGAVS